jgi:mono/diheme cytochrome c family protein
VKPRLPQLVAMLASISAVLAIAGCDSVENADTERGRQLFLDNCARCHSLAAAPAQATIGPDLDAAFAEARAQGSDNDTVEGVVSAQIENPRPASPDDASVYMPADLVTGDDARDVAAYVGQVAGVPGIEPPQAAGGEGGQIFTNNGCGSCHTLAIAESTGAVGPNLDDVLPGQPTSMIQQSIEDPNAQISQGFQDGIMPQDYADTIPPEDLKFLVKWLSQNAGQSGGK